MIYTSFSYPIIGQVQRLDASVRVFIDKTRAIGTPVGFSANTNPLKGDFLYKATNGASGFLMLETNCDSTGSFNTNDLAEVITKGIICLPVDSTLTNPTYGTAVYWDASAGKVTTTDSSNTLIGKVVSNAFKAQQINNTQLLDAVFVEIGE